MADRRPPLNLDRSAEDWSFLAEAKLETPWDRFKYLPLGRGGAYITLAGEARLTYELYDHPGWGQGTQDHNGYLLQRLMGSADAHLGPRFRLFVELQSSTIEGRKGGPRPSQDQNRLDLSQIFAGWQPSQGEGKKRLELRLGRQELNYGEGSLLAVRDLNVRRPFDGLKAIVHAGAWRVDLLAFRPTQLNTGSFDDKPEKTQSLWGVWAVKSNHGPSFWTRADLYYLGLERQRGKFEQGTSREERHTAGINLHGHRGSLTTFTEVDAQLGRFGKSPLRAWKVVQRLTWSFPSHRMQPIFKLQGAISSGDKDPASPQLETFHPLFPRGLYYGRLDSNGSLNALVIHPQIDLSLSTTVSLQASHFSFWRQSRRDGLYSQPGGLLVPGAGSRNREVGNLEELSVRWQTDRYSYVEWLAAYYEAGGFLRETLERPEDMFYLSLRWSFKL